MAAVASGFCATRVIASITCCKQCGGQLSRKDPYYLSTNSEHDTFQVHVLSYQGGNNETRQNSAISTHMRHVQCNINPYATRTVQHRSICDRYSPAPLHMRHVQCNTAPYATRTVQHRSICDTYSALTPIHAICDTYMRDAWW